MSPELLYGVGFVALASAIGWGVYKSAQKSPRATAVTEKAARELREHPETYDAKRPAPEREARARQAEDTGTPD